MAPQEAQFLVDAAWGTGPFGSETRGGADGRSEPMRVVRSIGIESLRDATVDVKSTGTGASGGRSTALASVPGGGRDGMAMVAASGAFRTGAASRFPHSRQKLASVGLSTPQALQGTRSAVAVGCGASRRSGAIDSTEPQSRQYLTWPGLLRPQREHSTHAGDRGVPCESSAKSPESRQIARDGCYLGLAGPTRWEASVFALDSPGAVSLKPASGVQNPGRLGPDEHYGNLPR